MKFWLAAITAVAAAPWRARRLEKVGVCALARDEGAFLAEWLDFYAHQGVRKAYLYVDDASKDDTWAVLRPYVASKFVDAFEWPPKPNSDLATEIVAKGWTNEIEPLKKTRHFVDDCRLMKGKPSHCAGHYQASSHCIGRAREDGLDWVGLIDPDEFWFSPRFGSLPRLLAIERVRNSVGVGQNAFIYGSGGVEGKCAALPPVTTTHLARGNASKVERWSKFPWVRLDAVHLNRVRVHEHDFENFWCHTKECRGSKHDPFRPPAFKNASCCDRVARVPSARDLRLNHYQFKSAKCSLEKAARNGHAESELTPAKDALLSEVYDDAILPHVPPRYKAPCRERGLLCDGAPAYTFVDVRDRAGRAGAAATYRGARYRVGAAAAPRLRRRLARRLLARLCGRGREHRHPLALPLRTRQVPPVLVQGGLRPLLRDRQRRIDDVRGRL